MGGYWEVWRIRLWSDERRVFRKGESDLKE